MLRRFSSTAHLATSRRRDGLRDFRESFRNDVGLDLHLDIELLEPAVLLLQLLHPRHQRGVHATELGTPFAERGRADAVLTTQIRHRGAHLGLLEDRKDLAVAELRSLHVELHPGEKLLLLRPPVGWGDYREGLLV